MANWKNIVGRWGTGADETDDVRIDPYTNNLLFVSHIAGTVHAGNYFYIEGYVELDNTDTFFVKLVTPDTTEWAHFQWEINASGLLVTELYEGASGGMTGGSSVTPLNANRNSSNTSSLVITSGVTAPTTTGTTVSSISVGSSGWKSVVGGNTDPGYEMILKQNTTYCRKYLSGSDDNTISFRASWSEHTNIR